jgi:hypothetical protein
MKRYRYLGDRMSLPKLKGAECVAVLNPLTGKCLRGRGAMMVLFVGESVPRVVLARRLRKIA